MSRRLVVSTMCAAGALVLAVSANTAVVGAAQKAATATSAAAPSRDAGIRAGYHGVKLAGSADYVVGVDAPTPAHHNVQYIDFFPRSGLTVTTNQVVDFNWDTGLSPDSLHSATLLAAGHTAMTDAQANPVIAPDEGGEAPPLYIPAPTFLSTNPPPGSGAPGACGDPATPCAFDGAHDLSSGATGAGSDFFVKITAAPASPTTYVFHCRVHPFMQGSLTVVPSGTATSSAAAIGAAAAAQYTDDTAGILHAIDSANHAAYVTNPDGSHHVTISAGTETQYAEALEMMPQNVRVAPGDSVTWKATEKAEIHTVTFPEGQASASVDPLSPPVCEVGSGPDTAAGPSGCTSGLPFDELPVDPAPHGPATLSGPGVVTSSGILSGIPGSGLPSEHTFTFDGAGVYTYHCKIHDGMTGRIFATPSPGYWNVAGDGGVFAHGMASFAGSMGGTHLNSAVVGISPTPDPGYFLAGADGGVFALGDAAYAGSMGGTRLNQPVVGISSTPSGGGYRLVAKDGGIFAFGDAPFFGSMGGSRLNAPVVGMATTPSGLGYWLVASDGGVFAFGDAPYLGSMGATHLNQPVVGMAASPSGNGYWLVAADGGVFGFGDAAYHGGMGGTHINQAMVGMSSDLGGNGYWLVARDGGIFAFGDAAFAGSDAGGPLNSPMVGMGGV